MPPPNITLHNFSALEQFLTTPAESEVFAKAAWKAAAEIAKSDGIVELHIHGHVRVDSKASLSGWIAQWEPNHLSYALSEIASDWQKNGRGVFFRGSKLPDTSMGSFGFADGGVHLTPQLSTAIGYASSVNQDYTNMGRLLRLDASNAAHSLGFVSTWDIPLNHPVWSNFEYEDFVRGRAPASARTVNDTLSEIRRIAKLPASAFMREKLPDGGSLSSQAEKEFGALFHQHSYEAISPPNAAPRETFLRHPTTGLIKINPDNPKWDQWMARVQEASLRHFYEVAPLEKIVAGLEHYKSIQHRPLATEEVETITALQNEAANALAATKSKSWNCQTMEQAGELNALQWVAESRSVGSGTSEQTRYPSHLEALLAANNAVLTGNYERIPAILPKIGPSILDGFGHTLAQPPTSNPPTRVSELAHNTQPNPSALQLHPTALHGKIGGRKHYLYSRLCHKRRYRRQPKHQQLMALHHRPKYRRLSQSNCLSVVCLKKSGLAVQQHSLYLVA